MSLRPRLEQFPRCGRIVCYVAVCPEGDVRAYLIDSLAIQGWICLRMECAKSSHCGNEHSHWVRVIPVALHHIVELRVIKSVSHDLLSKELELVWIWEFSEDQQEGDFKEGTFLCKLLNRVSSILQDAFTSINERDCGFLE